MDTDSIKNVERIIKSSRTFLVSARTGDRVSMLFISLAGVLLNRNLSEMMLDQRAVVAAIVPEAKS